MPDGAFSVHSREALAAFLSQDPGMRLYELGDLDPRFFPHTRWFASCPEPSLGEVVLLYSATDLPVLLALTRGAKDEVAALLRSLLPALPRKFYAHLSPGLSETLQPMCRLEAHGIHDRMILSDIEPLAGYLSAHRTASDTPDVLGPADLDALLELYRTSYPGNWFDPGMLDTGFYLGIRHDRGLTAVAGVHVVSEEFGVAALGNIAVDPSHRGRGLATRVTAALCARLLAKVRIIGLNVKADNHAALSCYRRLGFERIASYEECMIHVLQGGPS